MNDLKTNTTTSIIKEKYKMCLHRVKINNIR